MSAGRVLDDALLGPYLEALRRAAPSGADAIARKARRERMLPLLRSRVVAQHARLRRWRAWRRVGLGALTVGVVMVVVALRRDLIGP